MRPGIITLQVKQNNLPINLNQNIDKACKLNVTFKHANAFTKDVLGIWGPRHKSTNGPHLYTVIVLSAGRSLMIST